MRRLIEHQVAVRAFGALNLFFLTPALGLLPRGFFVLQPIPNESRTHPEGICNEFARNYDEFARNLFLFIP